MDVRVARMVGSSWWRAAAAVVLVLGCTLGSPGRAQPLPAAAAHEVLVRHPSGHYLENLLIAADGAVLYTDYFERRIHRWVDGRAGAFAELPVFAVNLVELGGDVVVLGHTVKFTEGPAAMRGGNRLVRLDAQGRPLATVEIGEVVFGNGMVAIGPRTLLISDSVQGRIYRVDAETGAARVWLADERLQPLAGSPLPGANGLRLHAGQLYVANTATRSLFKVAVGADGAAAGPLTELARELPGIDDFAIDGQGTLFIATHRDKVLRLPAGGPAEDLLAADVEGCTSAALSRDGKWLYVLGTGGLFEGRKEEATLVRLAIDDKRDLFAPIHAVLTHPRCLNCHTRTDFPRQTDHRLRHAQNVLRGPKNRGVPALPCASCHHESNQGRVPGAAHWQLAPLSMAWEGLSPRVLCESIQDPARNGQRRTATQVIDHMRIDPLVLWAWQPGAERSTPPLPHREFVGALQRWAAAGMPCPRL